MTKQERPHRRRAPLGFGTHPIYDKSITLSACLPRAFVLERVFSFGDGAPIAVRVGGAPVKVAIYGDVLEPVTVPPHTVVEVDVQPLVPMPKPGLPAQLAMRLVRRARLGRWVLDRLPRTRERSVSVAAKVILEQPAAELEDKTEET